MKSNNESINQKTISKINQTPVRTAKNFQINNIEINKNKIPTEIGSFENIIIDVESKKDKVQASSEIENLKNIEKKDYLKYGLGDILTNQVLENANQNLKINIESKMNNNINIDFNFDLDNKNLVDNIEINANNGTKSTIIIKYNVKDREKVEQKCLKKKIEEFENNEEVNAYHNGIIKVYAKGNSEVNIIIVNLLNNNSSNFLSIENEIFENSKVKYTIIDFGGKISCSNYYSNILGENAKNILNTMYLGVDEQFYDLNYIGELKGKKSEIKIDVQGALKDYATKHFKGTIDFKRGCKKAKGDENESCMLLSDKAKSIALPMLLCSEEDVEGNHSTSSGKVGNKELFYIMSRGFELKEALKLLVKAKFNKILNNIKDDNLREEILQEIDQKLN